MPATWPIGSCTLEPGSGYLPQRRRALPGTLIAALASALNCCSQSQSAANAPAADAGVTTTERDFKRRSRALVEIPTWRGMIRIRQKLQAQRHPR